MPDSDHLPSRDTWIDERGALCPAPVIALARASRRSESGTVIVVLADDPAAEFDIPAWCRMTGNEFVSATSDGESTAYSVRITVS